MDPTNTEKQRKNGKNSSIHKTVEEHISVTENVGSLPTVSQILL